MSQRTMQRGNRRSRNSSLLLVVFILLIVLLVYKCRQQRVTAGKGDYKVDSAAFHSMQLPAMKPSDQIIEHRGYTLSFAPAHEQAAWVAYVLRDSQLRAAHFDRTDQFMTDPLAKPHSADEADYERSGYDRGHLAPAEDMLWSEATMRESFYYSNISPQVPAFNRGVWKRLEDLVRYWAEAYDSVYVVTGPVLKAGLHTIGHDHVSVPRYFYKALLEHNANGVRGIGFVLPNKASSASLQSFAVSIDSVEHLTGLDLFPKLPDDVEAKIESSPDLENWLWTRKKIK